MNSESHGAPPAYGDQQQQQSQQQNQQQESHGSAGLVKPIEALAHTQEWIDCPNCQQRVRTSVKKVPGDNYQGWWWVFCLAGAPCFCCCTMKIPEKTKFHYSTEHKCPNCDVPALDQYGKPILDPNGVCLPKCDVLFRTVKYNEMIMPMRYQQSIYQA